MPSDEENVKYLYLVLTSGGPPTVDWDKVAKDLDLNKGAATKRWSRLKQAMEKDANPGPNAQQLLWLCLKHSSRDKAMDWNAIAEKCDTTAGAASKRYSRLKQAFDSGTAVPPSTPSKAKKSAAGNEGGDTPTSVKRKRATKAKAGDVEDSKTEVTDKKSTPKRARTSKAAKVKEEPAQADAELSGSGQDSQEFVPPSPALLAELEATVHDAQNKLDADEDHANNEEFFDTTELAEKVQGSADTTGIIDLPGNPDADSADTAENASEDEI